MSVLCKYSKNHFASKEIILKKLKICRFRKKKIQRLDFFTIIIKKQEFF